MNEDNGQTPNNDQPSAPEQGSNPWTTAAPPTTNVPPVAPQATTEQQPTQQTGPQIHPLNTQPAPQNIYQNPDAPEVQSQEMPMGTYPRSSRFSGMWPIMLVVAGILVGGFIGLLISFSACFKQSCGPVEGGAMLWVPLATMFFSVPLAIKKYPKDQRSVGNVFLNIFLSIIAVVGGLILLQLLPSFL